MTFDPNAPQDDYDTGGGFGAANADDRTWGTLAHLGGILLGFIPSLIIMLTKGNESPFVRKESVEALNFQITMVIVWIVASILAVLVIPLLVAFAIGLVFPIMGAMANNKGENYRYPVAIRLVK